MPEEERREVLLGALAGALRALIGAADLFGALLLLGGDPHARMARQGVRYLAEDRARVQLVAFPLLVLGGAGQGRDGDHVAVEPQRAQLPREGEPGAPRLIGEVDRLREGAAPARDLRRAVAAPEPLLDDFAGVFDERGRGERAGVHIHANVSRILLHREAPFLHVALAARLVGHPDCQPTGPKGQLSQAGASYPADISMDISSVVQGRPALRNASRRREGAPASAVSRLRGFAHKTPSNA